MKILMLSDSHLASGMKKIIEIEKPDCTFHLGDSQFTKSNVDMMAIDYKVKGNCDFEKFDRELIVEVAGVKFMLLHGDRFSNPYDLEEFAIYAKAYGCDAICYGHIHVPVFELVDGITVINPGSFARTRATTPNSYMIVTVMDGKITSCELKSSVNQATIEVMSYE